MVTSKHGVIEKCKTVIVQETAPDMKDGKKDAKKDEKKGAKKPAAKN